MLLATIGLFAKTGKAVAVDLSGPVGSPRLLDRRELQLSSEVDLSTVQPYHAVMELPWPEAVHAAQPSVRAIERLALDAFQHLQSDISAHGVRIAAVGIVGSMGQDPARIGNPHIRAHAAEGQLFRRVLETAASACGLAHLSFSPRDGAKSAAENLELSQEELTSRVQALGKGLRPWRSEERLATAAAWAALLLVPPPNC